MHRHNHVCRPGGKRGRKKQESIFEKGLKQRNMGEAGMSRDQIAQGPGSPGSRAEFYAQEALGIILLF